MVVILAHLCRRPQNENQIEVGLSVCLNETSSASD
eukprot:COSAG02_NODE_39795_length_412_cov_24.817891_2_plen_34_part_01